MREIFLTPKLQIQFCYCSEFSSKYANHFNAQTHMEIDNYNLPITKTKCVRQAGRKHFKLVMKVYGLSVMRERSHGFLLDGQPRGYRCVVKRSPYCQSA